ncbi:MAG: hypothetical protein IPP69_16800 [Flavobacteriales bacterium]|nr:hypothetical protein [Flavobacteriales bacterium]
MLIFGVFFSGDAETNIPIREFIRTGLSVVASKKYVSINGRVISPVIANAKDSLPDLPDSTYDGWRIKKIYEAALDEPGCRGCKPEYTVESRFPYAFSKSIILSLSDAGWRKFSLKMQGGTSESETIRLQAPDDCDLESVTMDNELRLYRDSIVLKKRIKRGSYATVFSMPTRFDVIDYTQSDIMKLEKALRSFDTSAVGNVYLAIDPHPTTPMKRVFQVVSHINKLKMRRGIFVPFLIGIYICQDP